MPNYVTEDEAAKLLDVSVESLRKWRADNTGPPYYRGLMRKIRYVAAELETWADSCDFELVRVDPGERRVGPAPAPTQPIPGPPVVNTAAPDDPYARIQRAAPEPPRPKPIARFEPIAGDDWKPTTTDAETSPDELEAVRRLSRPDQGIMEILRSQNRLAPDGSVLPPNGNNWECPNLNEAAISLQAEKGVRLGGQGVGIERWADDVPALDESITDDLNRAFTTGQQRTLADSSLAGQSTIRKMAEEGIGSAGIVVVKR